MQMTSVKSSNLCAVGYNNTTQTLIIEFHNGKTYEYSNLSNSEYQNLMSADSIGRYFNQNIKNNYHCIQIN